MNRLSVMMLAGVLLGATAPAAGQDCGRHRTCGDFPTCAAAVADFRACGRKSLDRDGDGIPCEALCGGDAASFGLRQAPPAAAGSGLLDAGGGFSCRPRKTCKQMASCAEARHHLTICGNTGLDRDRDGIPCEGLCR